MARPRLARPEPPSPGAHGRPRRRDTLRRLRYNSGHGDTRISDAVQCAEVERPGRPRADAGLSIVVPVFNEAGGLARLHERLVEVDAAAASGARAAIAR